MKKHIENTEDIQLLVNSFYEKVKANPDIGYIFTEKMVVDWEHHLPIMYKFWENVLFFTGAYNGNPMTAHEKVHTATHLTTHHFDVWLQLFIKTVDELFEGGKAELAKQRAISIATVMQIKLLHAHTPIAVQREKEL